MFRIAYLSSTLLLISLGNLNAQPRHPKYPQWITNYEAARAAAKEANKPIFLVFRCEP